MSNKWPLITRRQRHFMTGMVLTLFMGILLFPTIVRHTTIAGLEWITGGSASLSNVDIDIFQPALSVEGLQLSVANARLLKIDRLEVEFNGWPWRDHHLAIKRIEILAPVITIEQFSRGGGRLAGFALPQPSAETSAVVPAPGGTAWSLGLDELLIHHAELLYLGQGIRSDMAIHSLSLGPIDTRQPEQQSRLAVHALLNGSPLQLSITATPLSLKPQVDSHLNLEALELAPFSPLIDSAVTRVSGTLSIDSQLTFRIDSARGMTLQQKGEVSIHQLATALPTPQARIKIQRLAWKGEAVANLRERSNLANLAIEGQLHNEGFSLRLTEPSIQLEQERLLWHGDIQLAAATLSSTSNLDIGNLVVTDSRDQFPLGSASHLTLKQIAFNRDGQLDQLDLESIAVDGLTLQLERLKGGTIRLPTGDTNRDTTSLTVGDTSRAVTASGANPEQDFHYRIGDLQISGESRLIYRDLTVTPAFQQTLDIGRLAIGAIDSHLSEKAVSVALESRLNEFSSLNLKGSVHPFASRPTLSIEGKITAYEMPPISPYASQTIGYQITRGHLNADIQMAIVQGVMDGKTTLHINKLQLHRPADAGKGPLDGAIPIPLDTAISLLQDKQENITLTIPISGDTGNPNFDIKEAINIAIAKGMRKATLGYLAYTLQPFGAILMAADHLRGLPSGIRLDPITFEEGTAIPTSLAKEYPKQISKLLTDRPKLHLRVCGIASELDRSRLLEQQLALLKAEKRQPAKGTPQPAIDDQRLLELADQRSLYSRRTLINTYQVNPDQLYNCPSLIDPSSAAQPRVELLI